MCYALRPAPTKAVAINTTSIAPGQGWLKLTHQTSAYISVHLQLESTLFHHGGGARSQVQRQLAPARPGLLAPEPRGYRKR